MNDLLGENFRRPVWVDIENYVWDSVMNSSYDWQVVLHSVKTSPRNSVCESIWEAIKHE